MYYSLYLRTDIYIYEASSNREAKSFQQVSAPFTLSHFQPISHHCLRCYHPLEDVYRSRGTRIHWKFSRTYGRFILLAEDDDHMHANHVDEDFSSHCLRGAWTCGQPPFNLPTNVHELHSHGSQLTCLPESDARRTRLLFSSLQRTCYCRRTMDVYCDLRGST